MSTETDFLAGHPQTLVLIGSPSLGPATTLGSLFPQAMVESKTTFCLFCIKRVCLSVCLHVCTHVCYPNFSLSTESADAVNTPQKLGYRDYTKILVVFDHTDPIFSTQFTTRHRKSQAKREIRGNNTVDKCM